MEFYDSPVARINTKLLVPGFGGSVHGFAPSKQARKSALQGDYTMPSAPPYFGQGISPQIIADHPGEYTNGYVLGNSIHTTFDSSAAIGGGFAPPQHLYQSGV
jgi:hypothetical protein